MEGVLAVESCGFGMIKTVIAMETCEKWEVWCAFTRKRCSVEDCGPDQEV